MLWSTFKGAIALILLASLVVIWRGDKIEEELNNDTYED